MSRVHRVSVATFGLIATVPLAWIACGGSKPPETPADEKTAESAEPAGSDSASASASDSAEPSAEPPAAPAPAAATAAAAPAPAAAPPLGSTDCGRCIDKTCAKPAAACGKNADCEATLDSIHGCSSSKPPAACIDSAAAPGAAKPKKLATAFEACAKKAVSTKCKAKCQ
jgi:hypothetical protein